MAVVFPSNPNVGDTVTDSETGATWRFDGDKWVAVSGGGGAGGGGLADAPADGSTYGRKDATWVVLEDIFALIGSGGGDGSGGLSLKPIPGADPPVMVVGADGFVSLSEQGRFFYIGNEPYDSFMWFLGDYPRLSVSRTSFQVNVPLYMQSMMGTVTGTTPYIEIFNAENTSTIIRVWDENWANELFTLDRTGSLKLAGALTLPTNATQPLQAVTLQQVQSLIAAGGGGGIPEPTTAGNFLRTNTSTWVAGLPLTGGTLTGPGFLTINPLIAQASEHVFTVNVPGKQYQFMIAGDGRTWLGGYSPYGIFFDATTAKFGKPVIFESTVTLNANAASAMQAVPLRQVESLIAAGGGAGADGGGGGLPVNNPTYTGYLANSDFSLYIDATGIINATGLSGSTPTSFGIGRGAYKTAAGTWTSNSTAGQGTIDFDLTSIKFGISSISTAGQTFTPTAKLTLTASAATFTVPVQLANAAASPNPATCLLFGTDTATPVSIISQGAIAGGLYIGAGATRTNLGSWIARVVTPVGIRCESGSIDFFAHSGMTVGNSFVPSMQFQVSTSRVMVMNVGFGMPVLTAAPASTANGVMYYNSTNHTLNVYVNNAWRTVNVT